MNLKTQPTIMMVGLDMTLSYLLGRFAERSGYQLQVSPENLSFDEIAAANPAVILFSSLELLERTQPLVKELTNLDALIMVCSSVTDEVKARELGAEHCLLHPLTFDDFQTALRKASKRT